MKYSRYSYSSEIEYCKVIIKSKSKDRIHEILLMAFKDYVLTLNSIAEENNRFTLSFNDDNANDWVDYPNIFLEQNEEILVFMTSEIIWITEFDSFTFNSSSVLQWCLLADVKVNTLRETLFDVIKFLNTNYESMDIEQKEKVESCLEQNYFDFVNKRNNQLDAFNYLVIKCKAFTI
jgi:hypothetical protein